MEIDDHPDGGGSMLAALADEHAKHRTPDMELLRLLVRRVDLVWRQMVVNRNGDAPDPIEVFLPGEERPKKSLRGVALKAMQHIGR